ncbi:DEAD/DEAH box helicase [Candidatus Solirubrobacter pratensis]|uniref:DEAD/DEAH box helicase n=1 Tax=Candidatus Solirubrobacter pratensis TaxID=1298857 RepID=UPI000481297A|nr:DEAD/DEAH box helicase family protein [Candidatus Solirubrobacter pratensis]
MDAEIALPERWSQRHVVDGNGARQQLALPQPARLEQGDDGVWSAVAADGSRHPVRERGHTPPGMLGLELPRTLLDALPAPFDPKELRWVTSERVSDPEDVRTSLAGRFVLRTEDAAAGEPGLRIPQAGALHAILAHWSTGSNEPATVVLPTGTGKTETMVALFAGEQLRRVLVLVPSDNLRTQIAEAFETYGVLPKAGVLDAVMPGPVVGRIEHHFAKAADVRAFTDRCNVIVTTPDALNASSEELVAALTDRCTHLFVDEAHHVAAKSWARIRDMFAGKPVLQFTATPYRKDGERLGGRVIYSFPLGRAQELGYFQPISYISVVALADPDRAVAEQAIARLREDRKKGFDHLIMARVNQIRRARDDVLPIYRELAPEFDPQILHSNLAAGERRAALEAITERRSRVVVCVDMLGEGFNFPELKVAALHDPHRSLGVALQFIGRFARSRPDLGTATAVVARPEPGYDERLRMLYAEGNQWDAVIEALATQAIDEVRELDVFDAAFGDADRDAISIQALRPKMSTVVYDTECAEWRPDRLRDLFTLEQIVSPPTVNVGERVAWMVVESRSAVRWAHLQSVENVAHHLHVLHWHKARALLYINSSDLESLHQNLAEAVCGESASRITEDRVFRVLGELQRPTPTNVGVIDLRNGSGGSRCTSARTSTRASPSPNSSRSPTRTSLSSRSIRASASRWAPRAREGASGATRPRSRSWTGSGGAAPLGRSSRTTRSTSTRCSATSCARGRSRSARRSCRSRSTGRGCRSRGWARA